MRVNVYAEEMTDRIEIVEKTTTDGTFTGLRFYLELPVTVPRRDIQPAGPLGVDQVKGPFMHRPGDDDSAAVTFWGKQDLLHVLRHAVRHLEQHYDKKAGAKAVMP